MAVCLRYLKIVSPSVHDPAPLIDQQRLVVSRPDRVALDMRQLTFDCIGPESLLVGLGREGRPPAVWSGLRAEVHVPHRVGQSVRRSEAFAASMGK